MENKANNILVVVDFDKEIKQVIQSAIGIANPRNAIIHLLHISKPRIFAGTDKRLATGAVILSMQPKKFVKIMIQLSFWKNLIEKSNPGLSAKIHICSKSNHQLAIEDYIIRLGNELIVMGSLQGKMIFPKSLALNTGSDVMICDRNSVSLHANGKLFLNLATV